MHVNDDQIERFIIDGGLISREDFSKVKKKAKKIDKTTSEVLLSDGFLNEDDLRRTQAYVLGVPFVNLANQKIDFEILSIIPEPIARKHNIIAYKKNSDALEIAMLDTDDLTAIDFLKKKVGLKILVRITDAASIKSALLLYQQTLKDEFGDIIEKEAASLKVSVDGEGNDETSGEDLKKIAEGLPVVRIIDALLKHAIIQDASDIHIEPMENQLLIRYRIDGILHDAMTLPKSAASAVTARIKILSNLKLDEKRLTQDGRFKIELPDQKVGFRVSILPVFYGEKTVMRLLKEGGGGYSLEGLGFHGEGLEKVHDATKQKTGMILVTGPTGSGKSTTLYSVLDILNTNEVNISTIEDPIEYQMPRVNQTQVKSEIGLTFSQGLRALVRQDPDIIMVGEIRDGETASLAINAALTGHLVLSTLHTNSAAGAVPRLVDMEVEPFLLVSTIKVVIGQRLVRKLVEKKEKYLLSDADIKDLSSKINLDRVLKELRDEGIVDSRANWDSIPFYRPKPSPESPDGYHGRIGIHEVLHMTSTIRELVLKGVSTEEIEAQAIKEGMLTMIEDGMFKAARGLTSIEEILRVISE